jgi:hypothetical protein
MVALHLEYTVFECPACPTNPFKVFEHGFKFRLIQG